MIIILLIFLLVILIYGVYAYCYYDDAKGYPKISFEQFQRLYKTAPSKWDFGYDRVYYETDKIGQFEVIYFTTYFDCLRYQWLQNQKEKNQIKEQADNSKLKLLKEWQKDIDNYTQEYIVLLKELNREEK
jgi:hypothetical protein